MWEALREAVDEEMERDPTVLVVGEQRFLWSGIRGHFLYRCDPVVALVRTATTKAASGYAAINGGPWPAV